MSVTIPRIICCALALLALPAASGTVLGESPPNGRPHPTGGTLVWGSVSPPVPFNPTKNLNGVVMALQDLVFNRLIRLNSRGEYEPDLARTWEISADGLMYTFHLKEGIRFHDGTELTSDDVRFTYERILDPAQESPFRPDFQSIDRIETPGPYTLRLFLKKPDRLLLKRLVREILPQHLLQSEGLSAQRFYEHPVGTGPFSFSYWGVERESVTLEANPDYFEGRPYLDRIHVVLYPNNSALWKAFMRLDVDLVEFINYEDYLVAAKDDNFKVYASDWGMYSALLFNTNDPIWHERKLRLAVSLGIDRDRIAALLSTDGYGNNDVDGNNEYSSSTEISKIYYDPDQARALLDAMGWQLNTSGLRQKEGQDLELRILVDGRNATERRLIRIIRQELAHIGIRVSVRLYEDNADLLEIEGWDPPPQAWLRYLPDPNVFGLADLDIWYSGSTEPLKMWFYKNEEVDVLFEEIHRSEDPEDQERLLKQAHGLINADMPAIALYYPKSYFAVSARLADTDEYFSHSQPAYTIKDWYMSP